MQDAVDVRFSKSELNSLAKTKGTCVTLEKKTRVVFLLPSQLADIKTGIRENLDSNLLKYDYETKAIIIGYEKIKILSKYGSICYGYSKIALRIEANFYLFKPAVGRILQGVVCKQSGRHLGCLVHKGFNVSIPLEDEDGYACGWDFSIGQDVKFTVVKLDLTSGPLPYILGQLYVDGADCGAVVRGIGSEDSVVGIRGAVVEGNGGGEDEMPEDGSGVSPASQPFVLGTAPPEGGGCWEGGKAPSVEWPEREGDGRVVGSQETGGATANGRNSLISQLLRTVEMSIAEVGEVGSPKKGKQKRVSLGPQSPNHKGPRVLSDVLPLSPPLGKAVDQLPVNVTSPSGRKVGSKRGSTTKKGRESVGSEGGNEDSGSIIDRLLEMSRRELLGAEAAVETPRGKKRKAEEGTLLGVEEGSRRKFSRKSEGSSVMTSSVAQLTVKRESDLHPELEPTSKQHLLTFDLSKGGVTKWSGTLVPSEKSVPSKTHKLSQSKMSNDELISDESNLGLPMPKVFESTKPPLPSRVKRKSLPVKSEAYKLE